MNISSLHSANPSVSADNYASFITSAASRFAQDNNFKYTASSPELVKYSVKDYKKTPAWLGLTGYGMPKTAEHVVEGMYAGYPICMFIARNLNSIEHLLPASGETASRDIQTDEPRGIVRIRLPKLVPHILLDSKKNDTTIAGLAHSSIQTQYSANQKLALEGDFNEYFSLYAPVGLQVNVLTLLAPNMMQVLKNHAAMIDIEFYGHEMILITPADLYSATVMDAVYKALDEQFTYLDRLMASWNYDPINKPFDRLKKPFVTGSVIRVGNIELSAGVQLGAATILIIVVLLMMFFN